MNFAVFSEPKWDLNSGRIGSQIISVSAIVLNVRQNVSKKKASAEGNADVLEGFQEESGNEIDDNDSSDKEIPFSLGGTEEHGEVPGWVHFFIGRPTHSPDHHDYGHSNGQSKPSHYFSLMISVQNA